MVFQFLKFWFIICLYLSNLFYSGSIVASWPGYLYHGIYSNTKAKWQFTDIPTGTGNNLCFKFSRKFSVHMSYIKELYLLLTNTIKGIINCYLRNSHSSPIHQSSILKFEDKICLENTLLVSKFLNSKAVSTDLLGVPTLLPLFNSATKGACKVNNFALVFGLIYYYHIRSSCLNDMISLYCHMP